MTDPAMDARATVTRRATALVLGLMLPACLVLGQARSPASILGRNLVSNPEADRVAERWAKDWMPGRTLESAVYGRVPDEWSWRYIGAANGGERYFRLEVPVGRRSISVSQTVSIADDSAAIDSGRVRSSLDGWFGGRVGDRATMTLECRMLDGTGNLLKTGKTGSFSPLDYKPRVGNASMSRSGLNGSVPKGTRRVELTLTAAIPDTSRCEACPAIGLADRLSFILRREGVSMVDLPTRGAQAAEGGGWYRLGPRPSWAPRPDSFWVDPFEQRAKASYGSFETACDAVESLVHRTLGSLASGARWERKREPFLYADGLVFHEADDPPYAPGDGCSHRWRPDSVEVPSLLMTLRLPRGVFFEDSAFWGSFERAGWALADVYGAEGPNGTDFDFVCHDAICIIDWTGGEISDDEDSTSVFDGEGVIGVRCVPRPGMDPGRPWRR